MKYMSGKFFAQMPFEWSQDIHIGPFCDAMKKLPKRTYVGAVKGNLYGTDYLETSASLRPLAAKGEQVVILTTATRQQLMDIGFINVTEKTS